MINDRYVYRSVGRVDMLDPKRNIVGKLNKVAIFAIFFGAALGILLNYIFRMKGEPGGIYFLYSIMSAFCCVLYIYLHEFTHAAAILLIKGEKPRIKFHKLVASCGSPTIVFGKLQYFFVASAPFAVFCALLIPLCILLPAVYFPLMFSPLCYNVFGSMGDMYMIARVMRSPRYSTVVDKGTELVIYTPNL